MKKSENAIWDAAILVDCPYCGAEQDLANYKEDPRIYFNLTLGECTTDFEAECQDCWKRFVVPGLMW